jgi:endoglucanase
MAQKYIDFMNIHHISWVNWNYSDDHLSGAIWKEGTCPNGPWTNDQLKPAGVWVKSKLDE